MRITMIAPFGLRPKGTTRWRVLPLARALSERDHSVRVLVPSWDNSADAGRAWHEGGVEVICVPFPVRLGRAAWPVLLARLFREALRGAPDVLHAFKPIGFSGEVAEMALRLRRGARHLVWADADDYEAEWAREKQRTAEVQRAQRILLNRKGAKNAKKKPGDLCALRAFAVQLPLCPCGEITQRIVERQERWVLSRADSVTVASRALGELVAGWRGETPVYLPNTSSLRPADAAEVPGRVVWLTRFLDFPPEGVADIWAEVVKAGLKPDPTLHVIGAGFRGEERAFAEAVAARGLRDTVTLCGWLEGTALAAELSAACVAVFPFDDVPVNRYKCPARLADLTALGVPVVAHAVGECTAYVRNDDTGLLLPPGSVTEFAQVVERLLRDDAARARMRSSAREHFVQHFAPTILSARLEKAYAEALGGHRN